MPISRTIARVLVLGCSPLLSGCMVLNVFQPPEVVEPGQLALGLGVGIFPEIETTETEDGNGSDISLDAGFWPELNLRYGLNNRADVGAKIAGIPPFGALYGDVRYQLVSAPVPITGGLGLSVAGFRGHTFAVLYPSLSVGTSRLWGGARMMHMRLGSEGSNGSIGTLWGLALGTSFGDRFRLLPEAQIFLSEGDPAFGLGLGIQTRIGGS